MKVYRRHRCLAKHQTFNKFARCAITKTAWVAGEGPYALVAWCGTPTVTLNATEDVAQAYMAEIARTGCGGHCIRRHEIVLLDIGEVAS